VGFDPREPHQLSHRDWTVLLCHPDGSIGDDIGCGLYVDDCRVLSRYRLTLSAGPLEAANSQAPEADTWIGSARVLLTGGAPEGPRLPQDALEVRIERLVGAGMLERITIFNHSMAPTSTDLSIELAADFQDVLEVAQRRRQQHGATKVSEASGRAALRYSAANGEWHTERGVRVTVIDGDVAVDVDRETVRLSTSILLPASGSWSAGFAFAPLRDGRWARPTALTNAWSKSSHERAAWRARRPRIETSGTRSAGAWQVAADDVYALRNRDLERVAHEGWVLNAGTPIFTGLFGRDVLTAGWQASMLGPQAATGALAIVAALQATRDDAWRDSEPGKLIHELRRGPLADLHITAQSGYYGTQTTAAMFPLTVTERWHWTGDERSLLQHRATLERALEWADRYGDSDGDEFLEYQQRSPVGIRNQAWKDSHEAIRYPDGTLVESPIATVEEQAFHFLALCRAAEMCVVLNDDTSADKYLDRARRLRDQWHASFWMPSEGFYAMALDPDKRQVASIGSNAGHALAAGLVPVEHASAVVARLMADDMFSGWGIRTLSTQHPSFNPWAYHLGTVWPVENATFALGFKRYGFDAEADRIVSALLDAAALLPGNRLPELIGGQSRTETAFPIVYPDANAPQAWSATATLQLFQISLGLYPFAALKTLALVRPRLPEGFDELTLRDMRVGRARVSIRFRRRPDGSASHEVIERHGAIVVVEAPPPEIAHPRSLREAVSATVLAHAPGRLARAGRIALGMID
jgi:glycogen debranching enzyme